MSSVLTSAEVRALSDLLVSSLTGDRALDITTLNALSVISRELSAAIQPSGLVCPVAIEVLCVAHHGAPERTEGAHSVST